VAIVASIYFVVFSHFIPEILEGQARANSLNMVATGSKNLALQK